MTNRTKERIFKMTGTFFVKCLNGNISVFLNYTAAISQKYFPG